MQERSTPVGVKSTTILLLITVRLVSPFGKIQLVPISRRLVRFDAGTPDALRQQSADRQGIIANQFSIQTKSLLSSQPAVVGVLLLQCGRRFGRLAIRLR